jgi:hypothetical protein
MGLKTRSSFIYGHKIISGQNSISINEGTGEITVTLKPGGYAFSELAIELEKSLNDALTLTYTVSTNRLTRSFIITASSTFTILSGTGKFAGSDIYTKLGFTQTNKTGSSTYTSNFSTGSVFIPQAPLFDYVASVDNQDAVESAINQSGSGAIEVIKYGRNFFMECSVRYANDYKQNSGLFESKTNAVSELRSFMEYITDKNRIEFLEDRNNPTLFEKFILEKTDKSDKGLGFVLKEMSSQGLVGYYETGRLIFRKVT